MTATPDAMAEARILDFLRRNGPATYLRIWSDVGILTGARVRRTLVAMVRAGTIKRIDSGSRIRYAITEGSTT